MKLYFSCIYIYIYIYVCVCVCVGGEGGCSSSQHACPLHFITLFVFSTLYFVTVEAIEIVGVLDLTRCSRKLKPTRSDGLSAYGIEIGPSLPPQTLSFALQ